MVERRAEIILLARDVRRQTLEMSVSPGGGLTTSYAGTADGHHFKNRIAPLDVDIQITPQPIDKEKRLMINPQILEGKWNELKGQFRTRWGELTDDDLQRVKGNANQLVGVIQNKTGQARERIEAELEDMIARTDGTAQVARDRARQVAEQATEYMQEGYEQVSQSMREGYGQAQAAVQRRPIESIAIAFGSGLIAGAIVGLIVRSK